MRKLATIPTIVEIALSWHMADAAPGRPWRFPEKTTKYLRRACDVPAVYCWRVEWPGRGRGREVYVGETECLLRRLRGVLWPSVEENRWLNERLLKASAEGAEIWLETLGFAPFVLNGCVINHDKLGNPHVRRLLECMAILSEATMGSRLLNRSRTLLERQKDKFFPTFVKMDKQDQEKFLKWLREKEERERL